MKKLTTCLFVSIFLSPLPNLCAQKSKYLKLGVNYSLLRTEGGKSQPALTIGFGKKYFLSKKFDSIWGFEFGYTRVRNLLEDKTWPTSFLPPYSGIVRGGFEISLSYLDLSLFLGHMLKINKKVGLEFFVGPSIHMPVGNKTKGTGSKTIYVDPEEINGFEFDFYFYDADPGEPLLPFVERGMNINTFLLLGTKIHWQRIQLSLSYSRAFNKTEGIISLTLFDKIDRLSLSVEVAF